MYHRALAFCREQILRLRLRVKYRFGFGNLPAVATHLACFLGGTLLFEPDGKGKVPSDLLLPWSPQRIEGEVLIAREFQLVSKAEDCLLSDLSFRLYKPEEKKVFLIVPKVKQFMDLAAYWQKEDTRLVRKDLIHHPPCRKTRSNATIYP